MRPDVPQASETTRFPDEPDGVDRSRSVQIDARGHSVADKAPAADPVEQALGEAIVRASAAGAWSSVEALTRELQARREARAGVVDLAQARRRKGAP
jgi:hypothetical protein